MFALGAAAWHLQRQQLEQHAQRAGTVEVPGEAGKEVGPEGHGLRPALPAEGGGGRGEGRGGGESRRRRFFFQVMGRQSSSSPGLTLLRRTGSSLPTSAPPSPSSSLGLPFAPYTSPPPKAAYSLLPPAPPSSKKHKHHSHSALRLLNGLLSTLLPVNALCFPSCARFFLTLTLTLTLNLTLTLSLPLPDKARWTRLPNPSQSPLELVADLLDRLLAVCKTHAVPLPDVGESLPPSLPPFSFPTPQAASVGNSHYPLTQNIPCPRCLKGVFFLRAPLSLSLSFAVLFSFPSLPSLPPPTPFHPPLLPLFLRTCRPQGLLSGRGGACRHQGFGCLLPLRSLHLPGTSLS